VDRAWPDYTYPMPADSDFQKIRIAPGITPVVGVVRKVAPMAYDGMGTFELGIVSEVFGLARPELNVPWYEFRVFSLDRAPLRGTGGVRVQAPHGIGVLRRRNCLSTTLSAQWRCQVAAAVGLESAATLRVHFARALGIAPAAYRRRFSIATTERIETQRRFGHRPAAAPRGKRRGPHEGGFVIA